MEVRLFAAEIGIGTEKTLTVAFSVDNGTTYPYTRQYVFTPTYDTAHSWTGGYYYSKIISFDETMKSYLSPFTRITIKFSDITTICNKYWGGTQSPHPPYDYIDESDSYVQYYVLFNVEYTPQTLTLAGSADFAMGYSSLYEKAKDCRDKILNQQFHSGILNEMPLTYGQESWGRDNYIYQYHSSLAAISLIWMAYLNNSKTSECLVAVRRYIEWQFAQQLPDGGYYFGLNGGDLAYIYNYKIDSFSSIVPKLVWLYYVATGNAEVITSHYSRLLQIGDFLDDLITENGVLVDGWHWNEGTEEYDLSEWIYTHDNCENYEGYSYLALICEQQGNNALRDEYNAKALAIKNGINNFLWDTEVGRYYFAYNTVTGGDTQLGYPQVTPFTYNLASLDRYECVTQFNNQSVLGARYYETNTKEYPTFCGVNMVAIGRFDKTKFWKYYGNNLRFMFLTRTLGDMEYVDWADLTESPPTIADSHFLLIETLSWFIEASVHYLPSFLTNDEVTTYLSSSPLKASSRTFHIECENSEYLGILIIASPDNWFINSNMGFSLDEAYTETPKRMILYHPTQFVVETSAFIKQVNQIYEQIEMWLTSVDAVVTTIIYPPQDSTNPQYMIVDGVTCPQVANQTAFNESLVNCWYYDSAENLIYLKTFPISDNNHILTVFQPLPRTLFDEVIAKLEKR